MIKCKKHPEGQWKLAMANGKYQLCMDCIAEWAIKQGVTDCADENEKLMADWNSVANDGILTLTHASSGFATSFNIDDIGDTPRESLFAHAQREYIKFINSSKKGKGKGKKKNG